MYKIPIKTICRACNGEAYVSTDETFVFGGRTHKRLKKCEACSGTSKELRWLDLQELVMLIRAISVEEAPA